MLWKIFKKVKGEKAEQHIKASFLLQNRYIYNNYYSYTDKSAPLLNLSFTLSFCCGIIYLELKKLFKLYEERTDE